MYDDLEEGVLRQREARQQHRQSKAAEGLAGSYF